MAIVAGQTANQDGLTRGMMPFFNVGFVSVMPCSGNNSRLQIFFTSSLPSNILKSAI